MSRSQQKQGSGSGQRKGIKRYRVESHQRKSKKNNFNKVNRKVPKSFKDFGQTLLRMWREKTTTKQQKNDLLQQQQTLEESLVDSPRTACVCNATLATRCLRYVTKTWKMCHIFIVKSTFTERTIIFMSFSTRLHVMFRTRQETRPWIHAQIPGWYLESWPNLFCGSVKTFNSG